MRYESNPLRLPKVWDLVYGCLERCGDLPSERLISNTHHLIHKIAGINASWNPAIYYLYVTPENTAGFLREWRDGEIFLLWHGHILASCLGSEPTQDVIDLMKRRYGYDFPPAAPRLNCAAIVSERICITSRDSPSMDKPEAQSHAARFARPAAAATSAKTRSHTNQLIACNGQQVHKLKAKDTTGRWAYYFVYVERAKEPAFLAAIKGDGTIDLSDYGRIIASCYGEAPDQATRDFLKETYGFDV